MEKIHENMCFDVVFLYANIRTCLFTCVFLYFLHLVLTFTPHYIIMVKGLQSGAAAISTGLLRLSLQFFLPLAAHCVRRVCVGQKGGRRMNFCVGEYSCSS